MRDDFETHYFLKRLDDVLERVARIEGALAEFAKALDTAVKQMDAIGYGNIDTLALRDAFKEFIGERE